MEMENNLVLPADLWAEVFGHLSHTQKLISRLVCKEWNRQISEGLAKTYFSVKSIESHEVLLESDVLWTKLRIGEHLSSPSGFVLPTKFRNLITSLELNVHGLKECMTIVIRFPHIMDLDVTINEDSNKKGNSNNSEESEISQELNESFEKSLENLKYFSVTFPNRHYTAKYKVMGEAKKCLVSLKIQEDEFSYKQKSGVVVDQGNRQWSLVEIYDMICESPETLTTLDLEICAFFVQGDRFRDLFFAQFITNLTTLEDLKLKTVRIQAEPSDEYEDRDFTAWQNFLKTQTKMTNVILPWSYKSSLTVSQEFVLSLPRNLECIECLTKEHITDEFWSNFPRLERISLISRKPAMFNPIEQYPRVRIFQINFREDIGMASEDVDIFYRSIGSAFVNLAELHIVTHGEHYYDGSELQLVIRHLQQLRVLEVDDCNQIDDNAVTGIEYDYIEELTKTGRIYRCLEVPKEHVEGLPLSSLKSLEKLVLLKSKITDSGIYHGLQFGSKLKNLTFGVTEKESLKVTEWGLHCLAAGNSSLEVFDVSLANQMISKNGIEDLRRQHPLLESTRKFKVISTTNKK